MKSNPFVQAIENIPLSLLREIDAELKSNLGTSHYHRLTEEELSKRHADTIQAIVDWLLFQQESSLRMKAEILGRRRFLEGAPLGQVIMALILFEKRLRQHYAAQMDSGGPVVEKSLTEFFQKYAYYTAHGYEALMSEAKKPVHEEIHHQTEHTPKPHPPDVTFNDMEVSRGGDVGEVAG